MYVLNEKEYVRNILVSKKKPDDLPIGYLIVLIAKYYYSEDLGPEALSDIIKKKLAEFSLYGYQEYKYHNKICFVCNSLYNQVMDYEFKELEYIPIYEHEIKIIQSLPNDQQKKLMFTLFAIARYMNCNGWINKGDTKGISEVFKLANISLSAKKKNELLYELYKNGYISFPKKVNNMNIKVELDISGNIMYKVKEFKNIGNQYIGNFKKGYRQCQKCGKTYKIKSNKDFSSKYCISCSREIETENATMRKRKQRETQKCHES